MFSLPLLKLGLESFIIFFHFFFFFGCFDHEKILILSNSIFLYMKVKTAFQSYDESHMVVVCKLFLRVAVLAV